MADVISDKDRSVVVENVVIVAIVFFSHVVSSSGLESAMFS